jgi:hypothetical protein
MEELKTSKPETPVIFRSPIRVPEIDRTGPEPSMADEVDREAFFNKAKAAHEKLITEVMD